MISVSVLGRGLMATRARSSARRSWRREVTLVRDPADARVVILATSEQVASDFLTSPAGRPDGRLIYDLTGYSKRSDGYSYALDAALFGAEADQSEGVFAVPACYASSVLIPVSYLLRHGLVTRPREAQAVCIGGRSTLGASGRIGPGVLRLASAASTSRHSRECAAHLPDDVRCALTIFVGDLRSGILTSGTLRPRSTEPALRLAVGLDTATLRLVREEWPGTDAEMPFVNGYGNHFRFVVTEAGSGGQLRLLSYVHNLDLPLSIVYAHVKAVLAEEAVSRPRPVPGLSRSREKAMTINE